MMCELCEGIGPPSENGGCPCCEEREPEEILSLPEEEAAKLPRRNDTAFSQSAIRSYLAEPKVSNAPQKLFLFLVAVQSVDRRFGGHEEGGWYYDWTQTDEVYRCFGREHLQALLTQLAAEHPVPRYGRGSVLGGADARFYVCTAPQEYEEQETKRRPHYE